MQWILPTPAYRWICQVKALLIQKLTEWVVMLILRSFFSFKGTQALRLLMQNCQQIGQSFMRTLLGTETLSYSTQGTPLPLRPGEVLLARPYAIAPVREEGRWKEGISCWNNALQPSDVQYDPEIGRASCRERV